MASVVKLRDHVLTQEDILHWLALRMVPGLGTVTTIRLLTRLKSPQAFSAPPRLNWKPPDQPRPGTQCHLRLLVSTTLSTSSRKC